MQDKAEEEGGGGGGVNEVGMNIYCLLQQNNIAAIKYKVSLFFHISVVSYESFARDWWVGAGND